MSIRSTKHTHSVPALADDLLSGVEAIASYTGEPVRRMRHLIAKHGFPCIKRGHRIYSRKSWADRYYSDEVLTNAVVTDTAAGAGR